MPGLNVQLLHAFGPEMMRIINENFRQMDARQIDYLNNLNQLGVRTTQLEGAKVKGEDIDQNTITTLNIQNGTILEEDLNPTLRAKLRAPLLSIPIHMSSTSTSYTQAVTTWTPAGTAAGYPTNLAALSYDFSKFDTTWVGTFEMFHHLSAGVPAGTNTLVGELVNVTDGVVIATVVSTSTPDIPVLRWRSSPIVMNTLLAGVQPKVLEVRTYVSGPVIIGGAVDIYGARISLR